VKVLLFIDTLGSGGAQRQLVNLGIGLKAKGHDVSLLTYNKPFHFKELLDENEIKHFHIQKKGKIGFNLFKAINTLLVKEEFDVVYTFLQMPAFYILLTKKFYQFKAKVLVSERSFEGSITKSQKIFRRLYKYADVITANSVHQSDVLKNLLPKIKERIHYIANGLNLDQLQFKASIALEGERLKILSVGRITRVKNVKFLIELLNELVNNRKIDAELAWVGRAPEAVLVNDVSYIEECKTLIESYQLTDRWEFKGQMKAVEEAYWASHVLVHPSKGEGFPNVVCEGLALGTTVFASKVCDHPRIITEGDNGYLFDLNNVKELADKITLHIRKEEAEKRSMLASARNFAEAQFSFEKMINTYEGLLLDRLK
jgi:GalNAc-alpha-(1->4)-GalNAc-alpha-(1->3)-diNAcBac-PP-undecaprenol alpha-1,4-N-acetyl-D-galactosaminyltransferase